MQILNAALRLIPPLLLSLLCLNAFSASLLTEEQNAHQQCLKIYLHLSKSPELSLPQRLEKISQDFLNKPYLLYALGEGPDGDFDQRPRYRFDGFDCETFVTTVLALSLAQNPDEFAQWMQRLRYFKKPYTYLNRNHFTSLEWNLHIQNMQVLVDITPNIVNQNQQPIAQTANANINKGAWLNNTVINRVFLPSAPQKIRDAQIQALLDESQDMSIKKASISYLPLSALFDAAVQPIPYVWQQIPNGAVIEIVRPNWNLEDTIGTHLNVSHLGFGFWRNGTLWFRHASSEKRKVVEQPLVDYLKKVMKNPTIKGINVQVVQPSAH